MSHFSVAVFTEPGQLDVDALLEPFWEGIEFPQYVDETKAELIARGRKESGNVEISDDEAYKRATKYCDPENIDPVTKSIGTGKEARFTVFNAVYKRDPIYEGSIIYCKSFARDGEYFTLLDYEKVV